MRPSNLVFCLAFMLLVSAVYASSANHSEAEYLGGSIKSVPTNTVGTLDLNDPSDLVFRYGNNFYRLPFEKIKTYEIDHARPAHRVLGRVPIPNLPWKQDQVLNLSFRSEGNETGVLSFKLTGKDLSRAEWALKSRVQDATDPSSASPRAKLPESWWGDRYWRTNRNRALWPSGEPESAGTK